MSPRCSTIPILRILAPVVFVGGALAPAMSAAGPPPLPGIIVWDAADASPDRATRSLRFWVDPPAVPGMDAIRVTMIDLQNPVPPNAPCCPPPDFSAYESATCSAGGEANGCARWVGKPGTFLESQENPGLGSYRAARLQCAPFYHDWITETAINPITVVGAEITPSSTYSVQAYGAACMGAEAGCLDVSTPVQMLTRRRGDVWPRFNPPSPARQPDGIDIAVIVNKFRHSPGAPIKAIAQLEPNVLELNNDINVFSILTCLDAFLGRAYAFSGPCPCPSLAACGAVACTSATTCSASALPGLGNGSMCVKTCAGGTNAGDPCVNNNHCPGGGSCGVPTCLGGPTPGAACVTNANCGAGGACNYGFCRDRCGRCN